jgi:hypothetical protein
VRWSLLPILLAQAWPIAKADPEMIGRQGITTCRIMKGFYEVEYRVPAYSPEKLRVGVSTVYNNGRHNLESVWHPIPSEKSKGAIVDLQGYDLQTKLPERFVIGDGRLTRSFVTVDQRPGTKLDAILNLFVDLLPGVENGKVVNEEILLRYVQKSLDILVYYRWQKGTDGVGENKWDPKSFPRRHLSQRPNSRPKKATTRLNKNSAQ